MKKLLIPIICILLLFSACINFEITNVKNKDMGKEEKAKKYTSRDILEQYLELWQKEEYDDMYNLLSSSSKEKTSRQEFVDRYTNIFTHIGLVDMDVDIQESTESEEFAVSITFHTNRRREMDGALVSYAYISLNVRGRRYKIREDLQKSRTDTR